MRDSEIINITIFVYFALLAWALRLPPQKRIVVTATSILIIAVLLVIPQIPFGSDLVRSVLRDWIPAPILVLAYQQSGRFFSGPDMRLQRLLVRSDEAVQRSISRIITSPGLIVLELLEACYMLCYAMVPLGLASLYIATLGAYADFYWTTVLVPTYACYAVFPFLQTVPPRAEENRTQTKGWVRKMNLWILDRGSIHANTFPSGHAAAACAVALALSPLSRTLGMVFAFLAAGVCLGAITGRYHYTLDVVLGIAVAVISVQVLR